MYKFNTRLLQLLFMAFLTMNFSSVYAEDEEEAVEEPETMYVDFAPAFVVNLSNTKPASYLKAEVQLVALGEDVADKLRFHKAPIRHELVMLLSSKTKQELQSADARTELQAQAMENMNKHLSELENKLKVEEVLFTTFIIQ
ncbi:MAG: flagellar basal body-associated FliL family protein [Gammaproteobacteria bacterium]